MDRHRWKVGIGVACLSMALAARAAHAEPPADRADAEALSGAAAELAKQGLYGAACAKYEASARLDPSARRFMTLADCQERGGMTARAWMSFGDAQDWAQSRGDKALAESARNHVKRLEAQLGRIEIVVPPDNEIEGLQIRRDGVLVADAVRGVPVPVDPGSHVVSATAPGRRTWATTIGMSPGKVTVSVVIPFLKDADEPALPADEPTLPANPYAAAPSRPDDGAVPRSRHRAPLRLLPAPSPDSGFDPDRGSTQRTVGWVLGGTGLAGIAAGTFLALGVNSAHDSITARCGNGMCPSDVRDDMDAMRAQASASNVLFLGGIASLAGGTIEYVTARYEAGHNVKWR